MSAKGKGRNSRNSSITETPSPAAKKSASSSTTPSSIIRTRHQAVQEANPDKEIRRKPTPGIELLKKSKDDFSPKAKARQGKSSGVEDSEDDATPKRRKPAKKVAQFKPLNLNQKQTTPKSTPKSASKVNSTPKSAGASKSEGASDVDSPAEPVKRGRGRPPKVRIIDEDSEKANKKGKTEPKKGENKDSKEEVAESNQENGDGTLVEESKEEVASDIKDISEPITKRRGSLLGSKDQDKESSDNAIKPEADEKVENDSNDKDENKDGKDSDKLKEYPLRRKSLDGDHLKEASKASKRPSESTPETGDSKRKKTSNTDEDKPSTPVVPERRGRGRPKKQQLQSPIANLNKSQNATTEEVTSTTVASVSAPNKKPDFSKLAASFSPEKVKAWAHKVKIPIPDSTSVQRPSRTASPRTQEARESINELFARKLAEAKGLVGSPETKVPSIQKKNTPASKTKPATETDIKAIQESKKKPGSDSAKKPVSASGATKNSNNATASVKKPVEDTESPKTGKGTIKKITVPTDLLKKLQAKESKSNSIGIEKVTPEVEEADVPLASSDDKPIEEPIANADTPKKDADNSSESKLLETSASKKSSTPSNQKAVSKTKKAVKGTKKKPKATPKSSKTPASEDQTAPKTSKKPMTPDDLFDVSDDDETDSAKDSNSDAGSPPDSPRSTDRVLESPSKKLGLNNKSPNSKAKKFTWDDDVLMQSEDESTSLLDPYTGEYSGKLQTPSPKKEASTMMLDILASACMSQSHPQPSSSIQASSTLTTTISTSVGPSAIKGSLKATPVLTPSVTSTDSTATSVTAPILSQDQPTNSIDPIAATEMESTPANLKSSEEETGASLAASEDLPEPMETDQGTETDQISSLSQNQNPQATTSTVKVVKFASHKSESGEDDPLRKFYTVTTVPLDTVASKKPTPKKKGATQGGLPLPSVPVAETTSQEKSYSQLRSPEDAVLISPEAAHSKQSVPTSAAVTDTTQPKVDVISVVNSSLEKEDENTWILDKLINLFIQWQNTDAMCWLDVVLAILAHSPTLQEKAKTWASSHKSDPQIDSLADSQKPEADDDVANCVESMLNKLCDESTSVEDILKTPEKKTALDSKSETMSCQSTPVKDDISSKKSKLKFPVIITLIKAHEQAQYLLQNFLRKPDDNKIADSIHKEGDLVCQTSSNPQTGAGIKIISPLLTMLHKQPEGGLPLDALTHLGESIAKLEDVREVVWDILQPRLKCEKGKNDSPVFALPLLVRESAELKHMFSIEYSLVFHCAKCDYRQENKFQKALPSLPNVPADFSMKDPAFIRNCFRCEAPGQKMEMKIHRMQDIAMLHFLQGLPKVVYDELDFEFEGSLYSVTAVVQYKNNPDHFVSWLRNPQGNQWMECDDLKSPLCQFENAPPRIPPEQIHIVMWEKNIALTPARDLENSKTAGLLSSLLMSTRMVTMSSEGNSKVLTTVPIQYTPVSTAVGKRKGDVIAVSAPQGGNKIVMYPALNTRPNIISHTKGVTATQSAATTAVASTDPSAQAKPGESIQTIGGDKTKVVIVGPKNNQIPPSSGSSSEIRTVSIGGRIVRLTIEQLNAIRNSPGARVSIVGAEGTTTFSIKGLQNKKPDAVTPKQSVIKTPSKVVTQTSTTSLMSTTASPTVTTISSGIETSSASSLITSSTAHIQSDSPSTTVIQSTDSGQTIAKTTIGDQVQTILNQQSASSQTSIGTQLQNAALTPSQPRIIISKGPAPPATTDLGLGLDNFVDPKKPCRVVVDSKGQVTAIANKDGTKFIPLTNDKTKNRQILQDFFCKDQASTSSSSAATVSVSLPGGNLTSLLGPTQPITVSAPGSSTVGRTLQIVTPARPGESPSVRSLLQPTPKPIPQAYSSVFTVNKQNDVSNFETAMAVDSISSPQSRQTYPSYNTSQYIAPARGRGSRGGRKTTAPRGRGRGMTTTIMPMPTPGTTQAVPSQSSTATTGKLQITPSQSSLSGQKVSSTNRKVAIPTNNGHILITVPAGRTVMECLRDPSIVKTLVKKFPGSATEGVPAVSEPLTISTSVSSPAAPSQTSPLPPRVPTNINKPSSIYSSELFKHMQSPTTQQSTIKSISVPKAQDSRIHQILQNSTSLLPKKPSYSSPSTSKTDVLSAALFESGVQEDTSSFVGKSSQSVIVQGVPQTDLYTTHGLDILSQGVVAASQTQDDLQQAATISQDSSQSTVEQAKSQAFDILTQGLLGTNDVQDTTTTQSMESQAMNILTGGITPQAPPAPSQGLDILTQGLNPPPVASSHSLDILTQGISPNLQQQLNKTPVIAKKEIPKASTLLTGGTSVQSRPTPSMKIGNIGATSGRKSMIMSPTKSRFKTSPPKPATIYTIKSNGSRSTEVVESTSTQPDTYSMLNPSTKAALKRKASGTTEYTSLLKKAKPDMPGHIISSSGQNVTTVFSGETAGSWKFIGPNSGETASLPVPVPIENEAATNEYLTQPAADVSASSSTEDSIFSKFGMTTSDGVDPREAEVLRQLYDAVSQAGQTSTEATTSTTDSVLGQAGDTSTSTTMSLDTSASTASLLTGTSDSLVTDTDGSQQTLGTDGTEQQIMASDPTEQKIVMGIDENVQQVVMGTETGQEDTTATDDSQQIVMGIDEHGQQVVSINGQQFVVGVDENGQQVLVGADENGQQIIMTMDGQILGTDGTTQIVTETASADQAGQIMGVDENGMTTMTADQILATTGSDQIFVGPNGEIISPDQLVIAPDGTITCPALEEMANSGNTTYLASSDNPAPTTSEQQVVIEEEVTTVAENVEI